VPYSRRILHQTAPDRTASPSPTPNTTSTRNATDGARLPEERAAFRELHAARLYGFALIVALGDRAWAAVLATDAIDAGMARVAELRHPERAAAWLRERVLAAHRPDHHTSSAVVAQHAAALEEIGIDERVGRALAALSPKERAALVADEVERFDPLDTATIVRHRGRRLVRLLVRARRRYAAAFGDGPTASAGFGDGPLARRVRAIAARALP
jgi:DNA-directed RNA polymerase specialized sigma24 family protein